jgi:hypothetical protein
MTKQYPQFEAVKVALKQDRTGYVLTLSIHPDDLDEQILRDFVGARYQVVMVRLDGHEEPMDRQNEFEGDRAIRIAGLLCRDPKFWNYLYEDNQILEANEKEATDWLRFYLEIPSRSELKTNPQARILLDKIHKEYNAWTPKS